MVSPSKKGKLKSKVRDSVAGQSRPSTTGHCQLRRGSKPLVGKKFYLDVKNHVISSRLETNLKLLGAGIEVFLVKEVDIVVSDRPEWTKEGVAAFSGAGGSGINGPQSGCGSLTPRFSSLSTPAGGTGSESPATVDSPREVLGKRRVKTRAEAMLVSARQQKQQSTIDPLENARSWRIPIWPVEKVFKWIKKIQGSLLLKHPESRGKPGRPPNKFKELKTPYVKFETVDIESRPSFKELPEWPEINLDCPPGGCPFSVSKIPVVKKHPEPQVKEVPEKKDESSCSSGSLHKKSPKRGRKEVFKEPHATPADEVANPSYRMTRKARPVRPLKEGLRAAGAPGYCEICRGDYSDLGKHLKTESHAKFAGNDKNFVSLDKLISKGPNVDGFLKMNGVKNCSELFGTRRSTRSGVNIHRAWSIDNALSIWKPDEKEDVQDPKENKDSCEKDDVPRRMLVPNGHHNNIQKNLDNHFLQSPKRSRLRLSVDERMTKYGKKDQNVEVVYNGFSDSLPLSPVLKSSSKAEPDSNVRKATQNSKEPISSCQQSRDTGHHLRSRLVPTSEDNANSLELQPRHRRCRNTSEDNLESGESPISPVNKEPRENLKISGKLCADSGCQLASSPLVGSSKIGVVVKRKRLSVEERLLEDNKGQECIPAKLRSSGYYTVKKETQENVSASVSSLPSSAIANPSASKNGPGWNGAVPETENSVVKPRRAKRTELSLLSVEAESFMFGESASKDAENCVPSDVVKSERVGNMVELRDFRLVNRVCKGDSLNQNYKTGTIKECRVNDPVVNLGFKCDMVHCDDSSLASDGTDGGKLDGDSLLRRKRRTHAEVFIHDNLDYYKFEISEQRLRHGETKDEKEGDVALGDALSANEHVVEENTIETKEVSLLPEENGEEVTVKTEEMPEEIPVVVPEEVPEVAPEELPEVVSKPTQPDGEFNNVKFSFESIPFSEPWYQTYQRQDDGEEIHFTSFSESSAFKPFLMPYDSHGGIINKFGLKRSGFQRKRLAGGGKNARKSPRCHASTLAIMSSLMAKRRKENKAQKIPVQEKTPCSKVIVTPETNSDFKSESDKELMDIAKSIDVMLDVSCKEDDKVEDSGPSKVQPDQTVHVQLEDVELDLKHLICADELINYTVNDAVPDVVSLFNSFPDCECVGISEEERGAINEAYERGIQEMNERLNPMPVASKSKVSPGRPRKRLAEEVEESTVDSMDCDSASESVSTCGTVSEVGSHSCKISRKKKRRNRTGWPRQLPKRKKVEFAIGGESYESPDIPVRTGRRGRPRKYPPKEDSSSPVKGETNVDNPQTVVSEDKDLQRGTKKSARISNRDALASSSSSDKLSEGPTLNDNLVNGCKTSSAEISMKANSSPNYSLKSERPSNNRLTMSSPEGGLKKFSPLGRRSKVINQNRRESPRKAKPQPGTKWDVWSIRKRR